MIIGITGKSGSGKTFMTKNLFPHEIHLCVDDISHRVLERTHIKEQIKQEFGVDLDTTDRKALGDIIFNSRHEKQILTDMIYSEVKKIMNDVIHHARLYNHTAVIDWILLPHSEYFDVCDTKILVKANEEERIKRAMARDQISREYLAARDRNAIEYDESQFDYIIFNNYHSFPLYGKEK